MHTIHAGRARAVSALAIAVLLGAAPGSSAERNFGDFTAADTLLVVAPHPDDESLCCAGAIARARAAGARVALVWITSGDAFELDAHIVERRLLTTPQDLRRFAQHRMQEAARAAAVLQALPEACFFLGYPDRGIAKLLHENLDLPFRSPHTGAAAVPYAQALAPGSAYTGRNLERDLRTVIGRVKPTWILAPSPLDEHEDHRATGTLVMNVLASMQEPIAARYWIVHGGFEWPWPRGLHPDSQLSPPRYARARALPWVSLPLADAQRSVKESAIRLYESQMLLTSSFMLSFVKRNEIYSAVPVVTALGTAHNAAARASGRENPPSPKRPN